MQTKGDETSTRIINSDQNYQPRIAHKQSQQKGKSQESCTKSFFMVTTIFVLILATKLQTVHLIFKICNQRIANWCNIEQESQQVNKNCT